MRSSLPFVLLSALVVAGCDPDGPGETSDLRVPGAIHGSGSPEEVIELMGREFLAESSDDLGFADLDIPSEQVWLVDDDGDPSTTEDSYTVAYEEEEVRGVQAVSRLVDRGTSEFTEWYARDTLGYLVPIQTDDGEEVTEPDDIDETFYYAGRVANFDVADTWTAFDGDVTFTVEAIAETAPNNGATDCVAIAIEGLSIDGDDVVYVEYWSETLGLVEIELYDAADLTTPVVVEWWDTTAG